MGTDEILVFGGAFDPIHIGHLIALETVADELGPRCIYVVPNGHPPQKSQRKLASLDHRIEMVRRATESNPLFTLSLIEVNKAGPAYTLDTMRQLRSDSGGGVRLRFVLGFDALIGLPSWHKPHDLLREFEFVAMTRPGQGNSIDSRDWTDLVGQFPEVAVRTELLHVPQVDVSSRLIRSRRAANRSIRYLVPDSVNEYICTHGLYFADERTNRMDASSSTTMG